MLVIVFAFLDGRRVVFGGPEMLFDGIFGWAGELGFNVLLGFLDDV